MRRNPQLAFKNEKGGVRKFIKPVLPAAPCLQQPSAKLKSAKKKTQKHRKSKYGPRQISFRVRYLPLQAGDLVELIKVLQTVAKQTQVKLCSVKLDRGALKPGLAASGSHLSIGAPEVFRALKVRKRSLADIRGL